MRSCFLKRLTEKNPLWFFFGGGIFCFLLLPTSLVHNIHACAQAYTGKGAWSLARGRGP